MLYDIAQHATQVQPAVNRGEPAYRELQTVMTRVENRAQGGKRQLISRRKAPQAVRFHIDRHSAILSPKILFINGL
jgi:hypothetical protein